MKGKKDDKLPKDSLAVINLLSGQVEKIPAVKSYKKGKHSSEGFAYLSNDSLYIYRFGKGVCDTIAQVQKYSISRDGKHIGAVVKHSKKQFLALVYGTEDSQKQFFADTLSWCSLPEFDTDGKKAAFLASTDTLATGSKMAKVHVWEAGAFSTAYEKGEALEAEGTQWGLTDKSKLSLSHDGARIFASLTEIVPPKDSTVADFERPGLDIWNWDAAQLPPFQKSLLKKGVPEIEAEIKDGKAVPFTENHLARVKHADRGNAPHSLIIEEVNPAETQWNIQNSISLGFAGKEFARGRFDSVTLSPLGKIVLWWDYEAQQWNVYEVETGALHPLFKDAPADIADNEDDHPMLKEAFGLAGWTTGDADVLVYDKYDIWKVNCQSGAAQRLTPGREKEITYRYINTKDSEEDRHIAKGEKIVLSAFDNVSKENGLYTVTMNANPLKSLKAIVPAGPYTISRVRKALKADTYLFQKGDFRNPMDLYVLKGKKTDKLSSINPQIEDYLWGTAELYKWTAFDGTALEGLLYKPENFNPEAKYPVMIYFYEKNSDNLYAHYTVAPSRSIINIPFYVSRGYVVFVPDIVYTPGTPGESAYNCIVSGAQSLLQYPWIDGGNMAIQGQSWGGYQVAYLITRTGMFKAAGAGAPVSNMTSAYGGIRWESGMSRQFQYEQTQSRIGGPLWDNLDLYMKNSPLFGLPNVSTPVLIMHNDADGAVPWYQGIEMFMGLRRLGKPAWLLEYNDEAHNLRERRNCKDLSIRLQQFFDHYLKGEPMPQWMKDGVPASRKNREYGY